jgi:hypothetical protein
MLLYQNSPRSSHWMKLPSAFLTLCPSALAASEARQDRLVTHPGGVAADSIGGAVESTPRPL